MPVAPDGTVGASRTLVLDMRRGDDREAGRIAEMRFARFFNNTPMAIASVDREGRIALTNARFVMLFGNEGRERAAARPSWCRNPTAPALAAAIDAAIAGRARFPPSMPALADDAGAERPLLRQPDPGRRRRARTPPSSTRSRRPSSGRSKQQFAQSQKMQAVGQLAGGIAHDFNNVLTAIIGFSDLLLTNHRPTDPSFQDIMNIKQNANRAAGLVRQLLAFSRRQTLRPKVIELDEVLSDISVLLARLLGETIKLEVKHGRDLWPIKADLNQLEQVIVNLAVNARDAMPDGGKLSIRTANVTAAESLKFREQGFKPGEYVLLEVADTGTGMTPEVMEKIFEPFFTTKECRQGHRPRPLHRLRHRQADRRLHLRRLEARARGRPSASSCRATRLSREEKAEEAERPAAALRPDRQRHASCSSRTRRRCAPSPGGRSTARGYTVYRGGVRPRGARPHERHAASRSTSSSPTW